jgi:DnaJ-domain-containing protein 1
MKGWIGKIVGVLLVLLIVRRPLLVPLLLGLVVGHLWDIGLFRLRRGDKATPADDAPPATDPHAVLGVSRDADADAIEEAYRRLIAQYHPDKVANAAPEIRELAERRAREINTAYETLQPRRKG